MRLRYIVVRLVPDPIRDEPINVGVILQSDELVQCKFIERIPKYWELPSDLQEDVAPQLHATWTARLAQRSEIVYLPDEHRQREIAHTDRRFLEWLRVTHIRHLQMGDIREAEVQIGGNFDFETFLFHLFAVYVAPKPRVRTRSIRSTLHTAIRREFAQLRLPPEARIRERDVIIGSFPWVVDFAYSVDANGNGKQEVGIGVVDLATSHYIDKAKDLLGTWADVRAVRQDVKTISVVGGMAGLEEQRRTISMVSKFSEVFIFDREKDRLVSRVATDLKALGLFAKGQMNGA